MNNTPKDEYEHKLYTFLKELDKVQFTDVNGYNAKRSELMKKYGFTDDDWYRACRLSRSRVGVVKRYDRKKKLREEKVAFETAMKSGKQDYLDRVGEEEIREENRCMLDISDYGLAYDSFLGMKKQGEI